MLARLQQFITIGLLALAGAWLVYFVHEGKPAWGWLGALLILMGYALFLALEFLVLSWIQETEPAPAATARQLLRAWWGEAFAAPRVFCWRQPFRSRLEPDNLVASRRGSPGVVLVHGFVCNRGFWNPWMARLRTQGVPFVAVNLEPVFGSIGQYVGIIEAAVQKIEAVTGRSPVLVAHSMGGLAVRAWLKEFDADKRVHRIVTIGTPHHGTWLARFGRTANSREMALKSPWLLDLAAQSPAKRHALFTCYYGHCDNVVFPASTATLAGADNRHIPATAHVHMAFQETVFNEVSRWLDSPAATRVDLAPARANAAQ
jgi:triacylglycerol lipase